MKYLLKEKNPNGCDLFQGIGDFIVRCTQAIRKFESLVHQIHKNSEDISNKLQFVESTNLFKFPLSKTGDELPGKSYILISRLCDVLVAMINPFNCYLN